MSESKRIALVTGAGSGIGRETALALVEDGFDVFLAGRRVEMLEQTATASTGPQRSHVKATDVTSPDSVAELFDSIESKFGRLDLLFNNAGVLLPFTDIEDLSIEAWQQVVDVNLTGVFLCTQAAVRLMKKQQPQGGRIINNGSISAQVPRPRSIAYNATKHAVTGITKSTSLDGRKFNIACGQIDIGNADTSMVTEMKAGVLQADGTSANEPTMNPRDVARTIVYMANLPLDTNVPFMTIMANQMPFIGRG